MSLLNFNVDGVGTSPTKLESKARTFNLTIDEPESLGGKDEAPNPVEYILAGYAGCLNVVFNLVAKERGIKIDKLSFNVEGGLDPARLFGTSNKERAGFQQINVGIQVDSTASKEELTALLAEVKNRCPVNDTLTNPTPISYELNHAAA